MHSIPHEFAIGGIFIPPLLIAGMLGAIAAVVTARLLNRYRLSKYFFIRRWYFWRAGQTPAGV